MNRKDHETLDNSSPLQTLELLLTFFTMYRYVKLDESFIAWGGFDGYFHAPLFFSDDEVQIPIELEIEVKNILKKSSSKLPRFMDIAKEYEYLFADKYMDPELEEFLIIDGKHILVIVI